MMSKTKSVTLRGLRALYVVPLVAAGLACNSQTVTDYKVSENSTETKADERGNVVRVDLKKDADGEVRCYVNGTETGFDAIGDAVKASWKGDGFDTVNLYADPGIEYGFIDDVKNVLRGIQALKIIYSSPKGTEVKRVLPPARESVEAAGMTYDSGLAGISRDNIFVVRINSADKVLYSTSEGKLVVAADGKPGLDQFITDAAETVRKVGAKCVFSLRCDRGTSYSKFMEYQEALLAAYNIVREEYSTNTFNKSMDELSDEERASVLKAVPVSISEAETTNRPAR